MARLLLCYFSFFLMLGLLCSFSDAAINFKIIKIECFPNAKFISNARCNLKAHSWYRSYVNMTCEIVDQLRNVSLYMQIFQRNGANRYRPFLVNITRNLCDILDKKNFPAYTTIVINILKTVSNVNHSCPYTGTLMVRNLYVDSKFLPIVPYGFYKINFQFLEGYPYDDIGTVALYFEVAEIKAAVARRPKIGNLINIHTYN